MTKRIACTQCRNVELVLSHVIDVFLSETGDKPEDLQAILTHAHSTNVLGDILVDVIDQFIPSKRSDPLVKSN